MPSTQPNPPGEADVSARVHSSQTSRLATAAFLAAVVGLVGVVGVLVDDILAGGGPSIGYFLIVSIPLFPTAGILGLISVIRVRASGGESGGGSMALAALIIGTIGCVFEIAFLILIAVLTRGFQYF